ncbi:MAG: hypothetical protein QF915_03350, partial [Candidatus Woesearchaeota archaeon]|nr:hypothetical protein [Candidatus Woesearchaeota archaeon]
KKEGKTLIDFLDQIYETYGYTDNMMSLIMLEGAMGMEQMETLMATLRKDKPQEFGQFKVTNTEDRWDGPKHVSTTDTVSRNVLVYEFEAPEGVESLQLTIRPSGTQPATKIYFEIVGEKGIEREKIIEIRKNLRKVFLKHVYDILKINLPERGYLLSDLLPVPIKVEYFEIEKELIADKENIDEDTIMKKLEPLGQDPIEKIDNCFMAEHKKSFRKFFNLN